MVLRFREYAPGVLDIAAISKVVTDRQSLYLFFVQHAIMSAAAQPTPEWTTDVVQATLVPTTGGDAPTVAVFTGGDSPTVFASAAPPPQFTGTSNDAIADLSIH